MNITSLVPADKRRPKESGNTRYNSLSGKRGEIHSGVLKINEEKLKWKQ